MMRDFKAGAQCAARFRYPLRRQTMKADKRSLALILALVLICTVLPVPPAQAADVQPVLSAALARQASAVPSPGYGDGGRCSVSCARRLLHRGQRLFLRAITQTSRPKAPELTAASGRDGALNAYKSTDNCASSSPYRHRARRGAGRRVRRCPPRRADFCMGEQSGASTALSSLLALEAANYLPGARCAVSAWMRS